jgi:hypothetical protein
VIPNHENTTAIIMFPKAIQRARAGTDNLLYTH